MFGLTSWRGSAYTKCIALVVVFCFVTTTVYGSAPATSPIEIPLKSLAHQIEIPSVLGRVENRYVPPASKHTAIKTSSPVVVHIQDAHASYEGQIHTQDILKHLHDQYGVELLFLEGGIGEARPEYLQFFQDAQLSLKTVEILAEDNLIGGGELFLFKHWLKDKSSSYKAFGAEDQEFYHENLSSYRTVLNQKEKAQNYLDVFKEKLSTAASHKFNTELKEYFKSWLLHEEIGADWTRHLKGLKVAADKHLRLRFDQIQTQVKWPQLVRFFKIEQFEKEISKDQLAREMDEFREVVNSLTMDAQLKDSIQQILDDSQENPNLRLRLLLEDFYKQASPQGFSFDDYSELQKHFAILMLSQELRVEQLLSEVKRLNHLILKELTKTNEERKLLELYQRFLTLKKLLYLTLQPDDYKQIKKDPFSFYPSQLKKEISRSILKDEGSILPRQAGESQSAQSGVSPLLEVDKIYENALNFYEGAIRREQAIYQNMIREMKREKKTHAVLVTGGFHSDGLQEIFRKEGIAYVEVSPSISSFAQDDGYEKIMLLEDGFSESQILSQRIVTGLDNFQEDDQPYFQTRILQAAKRAHFDVTGEELQDVLSIDGPAVLLQDGLSWFSSETRMPSQDVLDEPSLEVIDGETLRREMFEGSVLENIITRVEVDDKFNSQDELVGTFYTKDNSYDFRMTASKVRIDGSEEWIINSMPSGMISTYDPEVSKYALEYFRVRSRWVRDRGFQYVHFEAFPGSTAAGLIHAVLALSTDETAVYELEAKEGWGILKVDLTKLDLETPRSETRNQKPLLLEADFEGLNYTDTFKTLFTKWYSESGWFNTLFMEGGPDQDFYESSAEGAEEKKVWAIALSARQMQVLASFQEAYERGLPLESLSGLSAVLKTMQDNLLKAQVKFVKGEAKQPSTWVGYPQLFVLFNEENLPLTFEVLRRKYEQYKAAQSETRSQNDAWFEQVSTEGFSNSRHGEGLQAIVDQGIDALPDVPRLIALMDEARNMARLVRLTQSITHILVTSATSARDLEKMREIYAHVEQLDTTLSYTLQLFLNVLEQSEATLQKKQYQRHVDQYRLIAQEALLINHLLHFTGELVGRLFEDEGLAEEFREFANEFLFTMDGKGKPIHVAVLHAGLIVPFGKKFEIADEALAALSEALSNEVIHELLVERVASSETRAQKAEEQIRKLIREHFQLDDPVSDASRQTENPNTPYLPKSERPEAVQRIFDKLDINPTSRVLEIGSDMKGGVGLITKLMGASRVVLVEREDVVPQLQLAIRLNQEFLKDAEEPISVIKGNFAEPAIINQVRGLGPYDHIVMHDVVDVIGARNSGMANQIRTILEDPRKKRELSAEEVVEFEGYLRHLELFSSNTLSTSDANQVEAILNQIAELALNASTLFISLRHPEEHPSSQELIQQAYSRMEAVWRQAGIQFTYERVLAPNSRGLVRARLYQFEQEEAAQEVLAEETDRITLTEDRVQQELGVLWTFPLKMEIAAAARGRTFESDIELREFVAQEYERITGKALPRSEIRKKDDEPEEVNPEEYEKYKEGYMQTLLHTLERDVLQKKLNYHSKWLNFFEKGLAATSLLVVGALIYFVFGMFYDWIKPTYLYVAIFGGGFFVYSVYAVIATLKVFQHDGDVKALLPDLQNAQAFISTYTTSYPLDPNISVNQTTISANTGESHEVFGVYNFSQVTRIIFPEIISEPETVEHPEFWIPAASSFFKDPVPFEKWFVSERAKPEMVTSGVAVYPNVDHEGVITIDLNHNDEALARVTQRQDRILVENLSGTPMVVEYLQKTKPSTAQSETRTYPNVEAHIQALAGTDKVVGLPYLARHYGRTQSEVAELLIRYGFTDMGPSEIGRTFVWRRPTQPDSKSETRSAGVAFHPLLHNLQRQDRLLALKNGFRERRQGHNGITSEMVRKAAELFEKYDIAARDEEQRILERKGINQFVTSFRDSPTRVKFPDHTVTPTGSYKDFALAEFYSRLDRGEPPRWLIGVSTGNHGRAIAYAGAKSPETLVRIYMGLMTLPHKQQAIRDLGAEVVFASDYEFGELIAEEIAMQTDIMQIRHAGKWVNAGYEYLGWRTMVALQNDPSLAEITTNQGEGAVWLGPGGSYGFFSGQQGIRDPIPFYYGPNQEALKPWPHMKAFAASAPPAHLSYLSLINGKNVRHTDEGRKLVYKPYAEFLGALAISHLENTNELIVDGISATAEDYAVDMSKLLADGVMLVTQLDALFATALLYLHDIEVEPTSGLPLATLLLFPEVFKEDSKLFVMPLTSRNISETMHQVVRAIAEYGEENIREYFQYRLREIKAAAKSETRMHEGRNQEVAEQIADLMVVRLNDTARGHFREYVIQVYNAAKSSSEPVLDFHTDQIDDFLDDELERRDLTFESLDDYHGFLLEIGAALKQTETPWDRVMQMAEDFDNRSPNNIIKRKPRSETRLFEFFAQVSDATISIGYEALILFGLTFVGYLFLRSFVRWFLDVRRFSGMSQLHKVGAISIQGAEKLAPRHLAYLEKVARRTRQDAAEYETLQKANPNDPPDEKLKVAYQTYVTTQVAFMNSLEKIKALSANLGSDKNRRLREYLGPNMQQVEQLWNHLDEVQDIRLRGLVVDMMQGFLPEGIASDYLRRKAEAVLETYFQVGLVQMIENKSLSDYAQILQNDTQGLKAWVDRFPEDHYESYRYRDLALNRWLDEPYDLLIKSHRSRKPGSFELVIQTPEKSSHYSINAARGTDQMLIDELAGNIKSLDQLHRVAISEGTRNLNIFSLTLFVLLSAVGLVTGTIFFSGMIPVLIGAMIGPLTFVGLSIFFHYQIQILQRLQSTITKWSSGPYQSQAKELLEETRVLLESDKNLVPSPFRYRIDFGQPGSQLTTPNLPIGMAKNIIPRTGGGDQSKSETRDLSRGASNFFGEGAAAYQKYSIHRKPANESDLELALTYMHDRIHGMPPGKKQDHARLVLDRLREVKIQTFEEQRWADGSRHLAQVNGTEIDVGEGIFADSEFAAEFLFAAGVRSLQTGRSPPITTEPEYTDELSESVFPDNELFWDKYGGFIHLTHPAFRNSAVRRFDGFKMSSKPKEVPELFREWVDLDIDGRQKHPVIEQAGFLANVISPQVSLWMEEKKPLVDQPPAEVLAGIKTEDQKREAIHNHFKIMLPLIAFTMYRQGVVSQLVVVRKDLLKKIEEVGRQGAELMPDAVPTSSKVRQQLGLDAFSATQVADAFEKKIEAGELTYDWEPLTTQNQNLIGHNSTAGYIETTLYHTELINHLLGQKNQWQQRFIQNAIPQTDTPTPADIAAAQRLDVPGVGPLNKSQVTRVIEIFSGHRFGEDNRFSAHHYTFGPIGGQVGNVNGYVAVSEVSEERTSEDTPGVRVLTSDYVPMSSIMGPFRLSYYHYHEPTDELTIQRYSSRLWSEILMWLHPETHDQIGVNASFSTDDRSVRNFLTKILENRLTLEPNREKILSNFEDAAKKARYSNFSDFKHFLPHSRDIGPLVENILNINADAELAFWSMGRQEFGSISNFLEAINEPDGRGKVIAFWFYSQHAHPKGALRKLGERLETNPNNRKLTKESQAAYLDTMMALFWAGPIAWDRSTYGAFMLDHIRSQVKLHPSSISVDDLDELRSRFLHLEDNHIPFPEWYAIFLEETNAAAEEPKSFTPRKHEDPPADSNTVFVRLSPSLDPKSSKSLYDEEIIPAEQFLSGNQYWRNSNAEVVWVGTYPESGLVLPGDPSYRYLFSSESGLQPGELVRVIVRNGQLMIQRVDDEQELLSAMENVQIFDIAGKGKASETIAELLEKNVLKIPLPDARKQQSLEGSVYGEDQHWQRLPILSDANMTTVTSEDDLTQDGFYELGTPGSDGLVRLRLNGNTQSFNVPASHGDKTIVVHIKDAKFAPRIEFCNVDCSVFYGATKSSDDGYVADGTSQVVALPKLPSSVAHIQPGSTVEHLGLNTIALKLASVMKKGRGYHQIDWVDDDRAPDIFLGEGVIQIHRRRYTTEGDALNQLRSEIDAMIKREDPVFYLKAYVKKLRSIKQPTDTSEDSDFLAPIPVFNLNQKSHSGAAVPLASNVLDAGWQHLMSVEETGIESELVYAISENWPPENRAAYLELYDEALSLRRRLVVMRKLERYRRQHQKMLGEVGKPAVFRDLLRQALNINDQPQAPSFILPSPTTSKKHVTYRSRTDVVKHGITGVGVTTAHNFDFKQDPQTDWTGFQLAKGTVTDARRYIFIHYKTRAPVKENLRSKFGKHKEVLGAIIFDLETGELVNRKKYDMLSAEHELASELESLYTDAVMSKTKIPIEEELAPRVEGFLDRFEHNDPIELTRIKAKVVGVLRSMLHKMLDSHGRTPGINLIALQMIFEHILQQGTEHAVKRADQLSKAFATKPTRLLDLEDYLFDHREELGFDLEQFELPEEDRDPNFRTRWNDFVENVLIQGVKNPSVEKLSPITEPDFYEDMFKAVFRTQNEINLFLQDHPDAAMSHGSRWVELEAVRKANILKGFHPTPMQGYFIREFYRNQEAERQAAQDEAAQEEDRVKQLQENRENYVTNAEFYGGASQIGASSMRIWSRAGTEKATSILVESGIGIGGPLEAPKLPEWPDFDGLPEDEQPKALFLTHSHVDHIGSAINLVGRMKKGLPVFIPKGMRESLHKTLTNMARDMEKGYEDAVNRLQAVRKIKVRLDESKYILFSEEDVDMFMKEVKELEVGEWYEVSPTMKVQYHGPVGHLHGAASLIVSTPYENTFFSGDISKSPQGPVPGWKPWPSDIPIHHAYMEATYGTEDRISNEEQEEKLINETIEALKKGGKVLIPAFANGRAPRVLHILLQRIEEIKSELERAGIRANFTKIYIDGQARGFIDIYQDEYESLVNKDVVRKLWSASNRQNAIKRGSPTIIISSSGNATQGMSNWYVQRLLSGENNKDNLIIFVGYMDEEEVGSALAKAEPGSELPLGPDGEMLTVDAKIIEAKLAGHASGEEILEILEEMNIDESLKKVTFIHGSSSHKSQMIQEVHNSDKFPGVEATQTQENVRGEGTLLLNKDELELQGMFFEDIKASSLGIAASETRQETISDPIVFDEALPPDEALEKFLREVAQTAESTLIHENETMDAASPGAGAVAPKIIKADVLEFLLNQLFDVESENGDNVGLSAEEFIKGLAGRPLTLVFADDENENQLIRIIDPDSDSLHLRIRLPAVEVMRQAESGDTQPALSELFFALGFRNEFIGRSIAHESFELRRERTRQTALHLLRDLDQKPEWPAEGQPNPYPARGIRQASISFINSLWEANRGYYYGNYFRELHDQLRGVVQADPELRDEIYLAPAMPDELNEKLRQLVEAKKDIPLPKDRRRLKVGTRFGPNGRFEILDVPTDDVQPHNQLSTQSSASNAAQFLGQGGFGIVYLVKDHELDQFATVKMLKNPDNVTHRRQLRRERDFMRFPSFRNVPVVYHYNPEEGYIVMSYATGSTGDRFFNELINQNLSPLDQSDIRVQVMAEMTRAIHGNAEVGIIHRDIKPENMKIDVNYGEKRINSFKLLDFGLSKHVGIAEHLMGAQWTTKDKIRDLIKQLHEQQKSQDETQTGDGGVAGTYAFISPEVSNFHPALDSDRRKYAVDLFALGVIFYMILTGGIIPGTTGPALPRTGAQILKRHAYGEFVLPSKLTPQDINAEQDPDMDELRHNVPPELEDLVVRLLSPAVEGMSLFYLKSMITNDANLLRFDEASGEYVKADLTQYSDAELNELIANSDRTKLILRPQNPKAVAEEIEAFYAKTFGAGAGVLVGPTKILQPFSNMPTIWDTESAAIFPEAEVQRPPSGDGDEGETLAQSETRATRKYDAMPIELYDSLFNPDHPNSLTQNPTIEPVEDGRRIFRDIVGRLHANRALPFNKTPFDDFLSDAFSFALEKHENFNPQKVNHGDVTAYLSFMLRNAFYDRWRRQDQKHERNRVQLGGNNEQGEEVTLEGLQPADTKTPDEISVQFEWMNRVETAIEDLEQEEQYILRLAADELSYKEIGEHLGVIPATAKTRLFRARKKLRTQVHSVSSVMESESITIFQELLKAGVEEEDAAFLQLYMVGHSQLVIGNFKEMSGREAEQRIATIFNKVRSLEEGNELADKIIKVRREALEAAQSETRAITYGGLLTKADLPFNLDDQRLMRQGQEVVFDLAQTHPRIRALLTQIADLGYVEWYLNERPTLIPGEVFPFDPNFVLNVRAYKDERLSALERLWDRDINGYVFIIAINPGFMTKIKTREERRALLEHELTHILYYEYERGINDYKLYLQDEVWKRTDNEKIRRVYRMIIESILLDNIMHAWALDKRYHGIDLRDSVYDIIRARNGRPYEILNQLPEHLVHDPARDEPWREKFEVARALLRFLLPYDLKDKTPTDEEMVLRVAKDYFGSEYDQFQKLRRVLVSTMKGNPKNPFPTIEEMRQMFSWIGIPGSDVSSQRWYALSETRTLDETISLMNQHAGEEVMIIDSDGEKTTDILRRVVKRGPYKTFVLIGDDITEVPLDSVRTVTLPESGKFIYETYTANQSRIRHAAARFSPGDQIEITYHGGNKVSGPYQSISQAGMVVLRSGADFPIPFQSIWKIQKVAQSETRDLQLEEIVVERNELSPEILSILDWTESRGIKATLSGSLVWQWALSRFYEKRPASHMHDFLNLKAFGDVDIGFEYLPIGQGVTAYEDFVTFVNKENPLTEGLLVHQMIKQTVHMFWGHFSSLNIALMSLESTDDGKYKLVTPKGTFEQAQGEVLEIKNQDDLMYDNPTMRWHLLERVVPKWVALSQVARFTLDERSAAWLTKHLLKHQDREFGLPLSKRLFENTRRYFKSDQATYEALIAAFNWLTLDSLAQEWFSEGLELAKSETRLLEIEVSLHSVAGTFFNSLKLNGTNPFLVGKYLQDVPDAPEDATRRHFHILRDENRLGLLHQEPVQGNKKPLRHKYSPEDERLPHLKFILSEYQEEFDLPFVKPQLQALENNEKLFDFPESKIKLPELLETIRQEDDGAAFAKHGDSLAVFRILTTYFRDHAVKSSALRKYILEYGDRRAFGTLLEFFDEIGIATFSKSSPRGSPWIKLKKLSNIQIKEIEDALKRYARDSGSHRRVRGRLNAEVAAALSRDKFTTVEIDEEKKRQAREKVREAIAQSPLEPDRDVNLLSLMEAIWKLESQTLKPTHKQVAWIINPKMHPDRITNFAAKYDIDLRMLGLWSAPMPSQAAAFHQALSSAVNRLRWSEDGRFNQHPISYPLLARGLSRSKYDELMRKNRVFKANFPELGVFATMDHSKSRETWTKGQLTAIGIKPTQKNIDYFMGKRFAYRDVARGVRFEKERLEREFQETLPDRMESHRNEYLIHLTQRKPIKRGPSKSLKDQPAAAKVTSEPPKKEVDPLVAEFYQAFGAFHGALLEHSHFIMDIHFDPMVLVGAIHSNNKPQAVNHLEMTKWSTKQSTSTSVAKIINTPGNMDAMPGFWTAWDLAQQHPHIRKIFIERLTRLASFFKAKSETRLKIDEVGWKIVAEAEVYGALAQYGDRDEVIKRLRQALNTISARQEIPNLWGNRIVLRPSGPTNIEFRYSNGNPIEIHEATAPYNQPEAIATVLTRILESEVHPWMSSRMKMDALSETRLQTLDDYLETSGRDQRSLVKVAATADYIFDHTSARFWRQLVPAAYATTVPRSEVVSLEFATQLPLQSYFSVMHQVGKLSKAGEGNIALGLDVNNWTPARLDALYQNLGQNDYLVPVGNTTDSSFEEQRKLNRNLQFMRKRFGADRIREIENSLMETIQQMKLQGVVQHAVAAYSNVGYVSAEDFKLEVAGKTVQFRMSEINQVGVRVDLPVYASPLLRRLAEATEIEEEVLVALFGIEREGEEYVIGLNFLKALSALYTQYQQQLEAFATSA